MCKHTFIEEKERWNNKKSRTCALSSQSHVARTCCRPDPVSAYCILAPKQGRIWTVHQPITYPIFWHVHDAMYMLSLQTWPILSMRVMIKNKFYVVKFCDQKFKSELKSLYFSNLNPFSFFPPFSTDTEQCVILKKKVVD